MGEIGALAVLHTWTRTLEWHPHVHLLVPGGALSKERVWRPTKWRRKKPYEPYLVPVGALSVKFWRRFLALARRAVPGATFPDIPKEQNWVVHIKPVLQGSERVLAYLDRYIHQTAISDHAIVACDEQRVTFRYRNSRDGRSKLMTLPGSEFLRRFLQHVPLRGLHRVRAFGLLHASRRVTLQRLQLLLRHEPREPQETEAKEERCGRCGQRHGFEDPGCRPPSASPCSSNSPTRRARSEREHRRRRRLRDCERRRFRVTDRRDPGQR